jgi:two-component system sensor histidine kinase/response regulator
LEEPQVSKKRKGDDWKESMVALKANILVVDDDEMVRLSCKRVLEEDGYGVRTAENGEVGLKCFKEIEPDLVLVDLKMPGKSGMEVLEEIETLDPEVVKIVITGYATVSSAVDAMKRGAYDFIPKPFTPDEISLIVARGVEKRRLLLERKALKTSQEKIRRNMVSLVSHELRAPLGATVQYLEVLQAGMVGSISSDAKELIDRCVIRLRELLDLIGRWISLATFDPARMAENFEAVSLIDAAKEAMALLAASARERSVSLNLDAPKKFPSIQGSKVCLQEIFFNLIGNAIKYNKQGGWVKVTLCDGDQEVLAEISDNGIGIPEEHLPRIFDEFYRVDGRRNAPVKGSGLGLSIVKTMTGAHGGRIHVGSRVGEGTTFRVHFPKVPSPHRQN